MNVDVADDEQQGLVDGHGTSGGTLLALGRTRRPHLDRCDDFVDDAAEVVQILLILHIVLKLEISQRAARKLPLLTNTLILIAIVMRL